MRITRRELLQRAAGYASAMLLPAPLLGCSRGDPGEAAAPAGEAVTEDAVVGASAETPPPGPGDEERLLEWAATLEREGLVDPQDPVGVAAARVGVLAAGTPYEAFTLEQYLAAGGSPSRTEPLTLHLDRFDCVSLVESCLAIARVAHSPEPAAWPMFAGEMERMRYRGGHRQGYSSRLHYFSEWLDDGERRGLLQVLGQDLGGVADTRPLRFMSTHPDSYPALSSPEVLREIAEMERSLDDAPRWVIPTERIAAVSDRIMTGDVLAFATSIEGLDVTHSAFAYRDEGGTLRVLHAPLSGGVVEVTDSTLPDYVSAIRRATGILVARPLWG